MSNPATELYELLTPWCRLPVGSTVLKLRGGSQWFKNQARAVRLLEQVYNYVEVTDPQPTATIETLDRIAGDLFLVNRSEHWGQGFNEPRVYFNPQDLDSLKWIGLSWNTSAPKATLRDLVDATRQMRQLLEASDLNDQETVKYLADLLDGTEAACADASALGAADVRALTAELLAALDYGFADVDNPDLKQERESLRGRFHTIMGTIIGWAASGMVNELGSMAVQAITAGAQN